MAPLRVLLVSKTLTPRRSGAFRDADAPWALGAFCLRSYVETIPALQGRVEIVVRSYPSDAPDELILHEVVDVAPDVLGFTNQPWNLADHLRLSRLVKRILPSIAVWHGGPMVLYRDAYLARLGPGTVDVVVEGEGEEAFADLLAHRLLGAPRLEDIAGIGWFDDGGAPKTTPDRANPDVARLPAVMTDSNLRQMGSFVLYETSRGCPFRCSFCNWGSQKAKLRGRDRAVIERDLAAILARPEVTHLWITDSGLDISREHVTFLADVIRRHKRHPVHVSGYVFLLHADLSYVKQLVGAFDTLQLGLQTANENVLSEMGRKALSVERFDRILDAVIPHYPDLRVDLIYGLPGIDIDQLRSSVRFLLEKKIWLINLYRLVAIPGTELGEERAKYGVVADEDFPYTVYASEGCSVRDLFEMQQFKVNMDTVRPMFANDAYRSGKAIGLDLVDFASRLHELVPRFNFRTDYGLEMDRSLDRDLRAALEAAVLAYTEDPRHRAFFETLFERAWGGAPPEEERPEPTRIERVAPARGPAPPPPEPDALAAPSIALRGLSVAYSAAISGFRAPLTPHEAREAWLAYAPAETENVGVHVHVPFCTTICTFCDCATEALGDSEQIERYLAFVEAEISFLDGVVSGPVERLYVGGGTPNLLEPDALARLLARVHAAHRFRSGAVLCLEGHPVHSTRAKLDAAVAAGINRVSFGVQSKDPRVLRRVNRGDQTPALVERAVRDAVDAGVREVNLDFIHGLADEPADSVFDAVTWGVGLGPSTVCVQLLNDSHFAAPYRNAEHRREVASTFRGLAERLADWVAGRAPGWEFDVRPDTLVLHRRDLWRDWRGHLEYYSGRDRPRRATLGYGRHAQSTLLGRLVYQNQERTGRFDPSARVYSARTTTPALELVGDLLADLEFTKRASLDALGARWGRAALAEVEPWLARLVEDGHLHREGGALRDAALSAAAGGWLSQRVSPPEPAGPRDGASIRVAESGKEWRIRFEPADEQRRYFGVVRGLGVFYEVAPGVDLEGTRAKQIMMGVVKLTEDLLEHGLAVPDLPAEVASRLDARLAPLGVRAKLETGTPKRHRLTVVAP